MDKKQQKYRESSSKEVFVGYSDFKERVSLKSKKINYHLLTTGGTGTGKTSLIASLMASVLRQDKPIIFVDGKGERKSMLEYKALCVYGKTVYFYSEKDHRTYNPIKNGTLSETRDKLMVLFSFSSEEDGAYFTKLHEEMQRIKRIVDDEFLESDLGHVFVENEKGIDLQDVTDRNDVVIFSVATPIIFGNWENDYFGC